MEERYVQVENNKKLTIDFFVTMHCAVVENDVSCELDQKKRYSLRHLKIGRSLAVKI